jgi:hypothetical protein
MGLLLTEEEWKSILLPEERIFWQLALPRNDRLYHIRLNLIVLFLVAPILISLIVILPVALTFDSTSTWLLGILSPFLSGFSSPSSNCSSSSFHF